MWTTSGRVVFFLERIAANVVVLPPAPLVNLILFLESVTANVLLRVLSKSVETRGQVLILDYDDTVAKN